MARGRLRIYLGAAPGVGKTYAMLNEGGRRAARGTDVVVGVVETHGRPRTAEQLGELEIVPRRQLDYRGTTLTEMDLDALLARRPEVGLVDELAHTNAPESRHEKRWQDIDELLEAGIDVISTVNIQHLESVNDVVESITGIRQHETVPDAWVRAADQIELVDQTPEALRRRMAHGNIYPPDRVDAALANYFREGNLGALRELALLWLADRVEDGLQEYRERHGITEAWETRERVVVALTGAPAAARLIRRASRMAARGHGELIGIHVATDDAVGPAAGGGSLDDHRRLLEELGGRYVELAASDVATALVDAACAEGATQLVLGASHRSRWQDVVTGSVIARVLRRAEGLDVHVIGTDEDGATRVMVSRPRAQLPRSRRLLGWAAAVLGPLLTTLVLVPGRDHLALSSVLMLYLVGVVATAVLGGGGPAMGSAAVSSLFANWYFFPPIHTWTISDGNNVIAFIVFVIVGGVVSVLVTVSTRRSAEAVRARAEATALAELAGATASSDPLPELLDRLRSVFALESATIVESAGPVDEGSEVIALDAGSALVLRGGHLGADDRRVLRSFANQVSAAVERRRLAEEAATARELAAADELRTALLAAVSHDLRTPLASVKASASSLLAGDVEWDREEVREFAGSIVRETDRLTALVDNLLDMSRITTRSLRVAPVEIGLDEIVLAALASLGARAATDRVTVAVDEALPPMFTDAALLERVVANLVDNALTWSPPGHAVRVEAAMVRDEVHLRVVDRGPGLPRDGRERIFLPFQRFGDGRRSDVGAGVGLGLAVAKGFTEALGGRIEADDTPGGGTTMVVVVPRD